MSHKSIRLLIEHTAKSLGDDVQFTYARQSDVNLIRDKKYPFISLDPLNSSPEFATDGVLNYMKTWNCAMYFCQLDHMGSTGEEYALILDEMDKYVDQFINKLNTYSYDSDKIVLSSFNQQAFIKYKFADGITGFTLIFTITAQDDFDYCSVSDEC